MIECLDRDVAAKAIYERRPFRVTSSESVMDPLATRVRELPFEDAPSFYQDECYELADAVIAALRLGSLGRGDETNADLVRHELKRRMAARGSVKSLTHQAGVSRQFLSQVAHGRTTPTARVAEALGFRRVIRFERVDQS